MNIKRQEIHERIFTICCLGLVFFMPIFGKILPSIIFLMVLNWIIEGGLKEFLLFSAKDTGVLTISFIAIYFLYLVGMFIPKI